MSVLIFTDEGKLVKRGTTLPTSITGDLIGKKIVVTSPVTVTAATDLTGATLTVENAGSILITTGSLTGVKEISVDWFGAKGDASSDGTTVSGTDDLDAFRDAVSTGATHIKLGAGKSYRVSAYVNLPANVVVTGINSEVISEGQSCFVCSNNTKITGITFDARTALFPMWVVSSDSKKGLDVTGCKFVNGRVYLKDDSGLDIGDVNIDNNLFECDFTTYNFNAPATGDYHIDQIDPISFYGQHRLFITKNIFKLTNSHRCIKVSDASYTGHPTGVSSYNTRKVVIDGNIITGTTGSTKQVIDCYLGTSELILTNNHVDVTGWGSILENKTGEATANGTALNTLITNNYFRNNSIIVSLQGSVGCDTTANDNHLCNAIISNNIMEMPDVGGVSTDNYAVTARFYSSVKVANNVISMAGSTKVAVGLYSNLDATAHGNSITGGGVEINCLVTNHSAVGYSGKLGNVAITQNTLRDFDTLSGGIYVGGGLVADAIDNADAVISVDNNYIKPVDTDTTSTGVYVRDLLGATVDIRNNTYVGAAEALSIVGTTTATVIDFGNSWNPKIIYADAIPTTGPHAVGDRILNPNAWIGLHKSWVCTVAGTPGTWVSEGRLTTVTDSYGAELVVVGDPNFATITGWVNNSSLSSPFEIATWQGSSSTLHVNGGVNSGTNGGAIMTVGGIYKLEARLWIVSGSVYFGINSAVIGDFYTTTGEWLDIVVEDYVATQDSLRIYSNEAGSEWYIDSISLKRLTI